MLAAVDDNEKRLEVKRQENLAAVEEKQRQLEGELKEKRNRLLAVAKEEQRQL